MGDGWETARNPNRPPVLEADDNGILQVKTMMVMVTSLQILRSDSIYFHETSKTCNLLLK